MRKLGLRDLQYASAGRNRSAPRPTFLHMIHDTDGAEIAEAAAVLPVMFMIILGIFWFGQAFSIYGTITRAAQDGARAAVAPLCVTCSGSNDPSTNAYNAVKSALVAAHLDPNNLQQLTTTPPLCSCGSTTTSCSTGSIACDSSQSNICVQGVQHTSGNLSEGLVQLSPPASNGNGVCGVSVSFRYPFRFWLPFTSLNKQQIWLQAQGQVRAEDQ
jgi:Flp pilus assembly protein TadG